MSIDRIRETASKIWSQELYINLQGIRWLVFPGVFFLAFLHSLVVSYTTGSVIGVWQVWIEVFIYSLTGSLVAWLGLTWISKAAYRRFQAEKQLQKAYDELEERHLQLLNLNNLGEQVAAADNQHDILELATRAPIQLTEAQASTIVTFDENSDRLNLEMAWGLSDTYLSALRERIEIGINAERCRNCNTLHARADQDCPLFEGLLPMAQEDGIASLVCLPVTLEKERTSVITAYFPTVEGPSEDHIRLLNILCAVISGALENLRIRTQRISTLQSLDRAISTDPLTTPGTLEDLCRQVLDIAVSGWDAQAGALFLFDDVTQAWTCLAQHELGDSLSDVRFCLGLRLSQEAHQNNLPVFQTEIHSPNHSIQSAAASPLITEGKIVGTLFLGSRRPQAINERHLELLSAVAHQIALAIRNAQLYEQLSQMAVLEERHRLSREFHDGLAQTLGFLNLQAELVESLIEEKQNTSAKDEVQALRKSIRAAYVDVREAIDGLRMNLDEPAELSAQLANYTREFVRQTGIEIHYHVHPAEIAIEPEIALQLLRIVQEALTNIRKHARASLATVNLTSTSRALELSITDDGIGFPPTDHGEREHRSYGLTTMRERAQAIGGTLSLATSPGEGTHLTITIPKES